MTIDEYKALTERKGRRKPRHLESKIQAACVAWFRAAFPGYLVFSVPNGGSRNAVEAANLKREGAMAGVSDLIVLAERAVLFVEMKAAKGRQSQHQKEFEQRVTRLGFRYVVCRTLSDFSVQVTKWIKENNINNQPNNKENGK